MSSQQQQQRLQQMRSMGMAGMHPGGQGQTMMRPGAPNPQGMMQPQSMQVTQNLTFPLNLVCFALKKKCSFNILVCQIYFKAMILALIF